jgi:hypothetical protein
LAGVAAAADFVVLAESDFDDPDFGESDFDESDDDPPDDDPLADAAADGLADSVALVDERESVR